MNDACTKKGVSPLRSRNSTTAWRTKVVCDSSTGNRAGAHVEPCASEPGKPSIGS